jgi:hypothetical protein
VGAVEFRTGDAAGVCRGLGGPFGLLSLSAGDAAALARALDAGVPLLAPGGLVAVQHYPDPEWPDVRRLADDSARRLGWRRAAQAGYLGVFAT